MSNKKLDNCNNGTARGILTVHLWSDDCYVNKHLIILNIQTSEGECYRSKLAWYKYILNF